jgi:quercetin 2,3-dioxygenase
MLQIISNRQKIVKKNGGFGIEILFPGKGIGSEDSGIGTIGRIDQATVTPGTLVPMHPHKDDEILTYLRSGVVEHKDTEGNVEVITNKRLMMMNAGAKFQHEELVLPEGGVLTALQIFIRPEIGGLKPQVQFHEFPDVVSRNEWREVAGKDDTFPLLIRSNTWIYRAVNSQKVSVLIFRALLNRPALRLLNTKKAMRYSVYLMSLRVEPYQNMFQLRKNT